MKLWDKIRKAGAGATESARPEEATFAVRPDTVYAPISGVLMSIEEINDEIVSSKLLGEGYGILPVGDTIYAPAEGRVTMTTVTNHAVGMLTTSGIEVIIHIGLGTVALNGKGFTCHVKQGDEVRAGVPLITFDDAVIKDAGLEDVVTVVVSNADRVGRIEHAGGSSTLIGDRPLVKIGDPLLVVGR